MANGKRKPVPEFSSEDEERRFWAEHDSTEFIDWAFATRRKLPNLKPTLRTISLRLPVSMIEDLKVLANRRDVPYQSLLKVFLAERLEKERMTRLPIAIGSYEEQKRFIAQNAAFLLEYNHLNELTKRMFLRTLKSPDGREVSRLRKLPEDDPAVIAFEDAMTADGIIFYLGRMAADDFGEILILAGNGRGFGAYKIVRGMYERIVTAFYIEQNPSESRIFAESSAITKLNYLKRTFKASPETKKRFSDEFMAAIERDAAAAQAKRKQSICSKCNQPITQEAWTRVSLDVMARVAESALEVFYPQFYLEGTAQSHANMFGIERRLIRKKGGGITYKDTSEKEARFALHLGHHLMVRLLGMQNEHFKLDLDDDIQKRIDGFVAVWGGGPTAPPEPE
jgi:predicted DNA binding CopG/RHH family protein